MKEMKKLRIGVMELLSELRQKDISDIRDVRCAILEENGKLSVFTNADVMPLTRADMNVHMDETGIGLPVVVEGKIMDASMEAAGVDRKWIKETAAKNGLQLDEILLMTVDEQKRAAFIKSGTENAEITEGNGS